MANPTFPLANPHDVTPGAGVSSIRFANASVGWAFGPALWRTSDGGRSWRRDTTFGGRTDQAVNQVGPLETADGYVYAVVHFGEGNGCTYLMRGLVGRGGWQRVPGVGGCGAAPGVSSLALSGSSGWLLLDLAGWQYYVLAHGQWTRATLPCPSSTLNYAAVGAAPGGSPVAVECSGQGAAGQTAKQVYVSPDGGRAFKEVYHGQSAGDQVLVAMSGSRLLSATWSAASWIYAQPLAGGSPVTALVLGDGGLGWRDFGLTTASQGFVIEGSSAPGTAMYMTRDGGSSWRRIAFGQGG